jgi:hypothetical protein
MFKCANYRAQQLHKNSANSHEAYYLVNIEEMRMVEEYLFTDNGVNSRV